MHVTRAVSLLAIVLLWMLATPVSGAVRILVEDVSVTQYRITPSPDQRWLAVISVNQATPQRLSRSPPGRVRITDLGNLAGGFAAATLCTSEHIGALAIVIQLESAPADTRTVTYRVDGGSASEADYRLPAEHSIRFRPGERVQTLIIEAIPDVLDEGQETLELQLAAGSDITLKQSRMTLTIRDHGACQSRLPFVVLP